MEKCKNNDKLYSIVNKDNFIEHPEKWKPKDFINILNLIDLIKKDLNENELNIVNKIEVKLKMNCLFWSI